MIRTGQRITIRPEWRDDGDEEFVWRAVEDEDGGRVKITANIPGFAIQPVQVVTVDMIQALP